MLLVWTVFLILLQLNIVTITEGGYSLDIQLYNVTIVRKSNKLKSGHAEVVTVDGHQVINANIESNVMLKNVNFNVTADIVRGTKMYRVYDIFIDFCKAVRRRGKMNLVMIIYSQLSAFGNMPHSCPVPAHINYTLTNFRLNTEQIPLYTPRLNFFIDITLSEGKEILYNLIIDVLLESKKANDTLNTKI